MPDSWIDREELASLAGELSRKKRRLSHHAARPQSAPNRPSDLERAEPREASRPRDPVADPESEATDVEPEEAPEADHAVPEPFADPEAEATDVEPEETPEETPEADHAVPEPFEDPEAEVIDVEPEEAPEADHAVPEPFEDPEAEAINVEPEEAPEAYHAVPEPFEDPEAEAINVEPEEALQVEVGEFEIQSEEDFFNGAGEDWEAVPLDSLDSLDPLDPLDSLDSLESSEAQANTEMAAFPSQDLEEDCFEEEFPGRRRGEAQPSEGVLTNLSIAEPDPDALRYRTPLFLREAEHLLEGTVAPVAEAEEAISLRSLASARARADEGGLLKGALAGDGGAEISNNAKGTASPPIMPVGSPEQGPHAPEPSLVDSLIEPDPPASFSESADEPVAYESTDDSLPKRLALFASAFARSTGSRNVCIVDEAGYPLHEDNPNLRLRSRGAELGFFPDARLTGGSELAAAQAFLAGRWHGIIRGASPFCHLFLRFDREAPLESDEMDDWSRRLVETLG